MGVTFFCSSAAHCEAQGRSHLRSHCTQDECIEGYRSIANEVIQIKVSNSITFELFDIQDNFSYCLLLLLLWEKINPI